ncbi:MAG: hypothetical protein JO291_12510 [Acidimicrobiia bacterium]|nr:hypothetical protein [Acidimicrobiia bacterium]
MARQLALLDTPPEWHLTDEAREAGLAGVARARAALAAAEKAADAERTVARRPAA